MCLWVPQASAHVPLCTQPFLTTPLNTAPPYSDPPAAPLCFLITSCLSVSLLEHKFYAGKDFVLFTAAFPLPKTVPGA